MKIKSIILPILIFATLSADSQTIFSEALFPQLPASLLVVDDYLYVGTLETAEGTQAISRIPLNNPETAELVSDFASAPGFGVWKMAYNPQENNIYAYDVFLYKVDLDQNLPITKEEIFTGANTCSDGMAQRDGIIYIACGNKIQILDTNLSNPTLELFLQLSAENFVYNPVIDGDELYFSVNNNGDFDLFKSNINDPSGTLELVSTLDQNSGGVQSSLIADDFLYLGIEGTPNRVLKLDLSDTNLPIDAEILIDNFSGGPIGLARSGNRIFISDGNTRNIWEFTDPTLNSGSVTNKSIELFPNPVTNKLYLSKVLPGNQFTIYSSDGKAVLSGSYYEGGIDVSTLSPGMYFIRLKVDGMLHIKKLIKD